MIPCPSHGSAPVIFMLYGETGVGKSTIAGYLASATAGRLIRISDIHKIVGVRVADWFATSKADQNTDEADQTRQSSYAIIQSQLQIVLDGGPGPHIFLDAAFAERRFRRTVYDACRRFNAPCCLLEIHCTNEALRRERILSRISNNQVDSTAEAFSLAISEYMRKIMEPPDELDAVSLNGHIVFDTYSQNCRVIKPPSASLQGSREIHAVFSILQTFRPSQTFRD